jgi:hypothetical protein
MVRFFKGDFLRGFREFLGVFRAFWVWMGLLRLGFWVGFGYSGFLFGYRIIFRWGV